MDNARYVVETGENPDPSPKGDIGNRNVRVMEALNALNRSKHFRSFIDEYVEPRLKAKQDNLDSEKDPVEMYRLQGEIRELKLFTNLTKIREALRNTLTKDHGEENE